ncbi:MAG: hypothetical protein ACE37H_01595 [Phycisphaeraceae bacterium]
MTSSPDQPDRDLPRLRPEDARLIDRLLGGEALPDANEKVGPAYEARVRRLLDLIGRWDAQDPEPGLARRTVGRVLAAEPASLSHEDGVALDALLALRRQGLPTGPMPAESRARAERIERLLSVLDRSADEPVPEGLVGRTMRAVEADRAERRRQAFANQTASGRWGGAGISIRQIATTAALLLMVLSVLLPVLDKGKRDAMIAKCEQNLAGLGVDLQQYASDNKQSLAMTDQPDKPDAPVADPLGHLKPFARHNIDGTRIADDRVSLFVRLAERNVSSDHFRCPAGDPDAPSAVYNGQNPVAGGPFRVFLEPRPIFADTNPLYRLTPDGLVRDRTIPGMTQSKNHDGVGQNMLISDGSVRWNVRPALHRAGRDKEDNIWLFQRPEADDAEPDIFLTP